MLMSLMLDNTFGLVNGETLLIPASMLEFTEQDPVAQTILSYYINHLLQTNKRLILDSLLPKFASILKTQPLNSALLNLMVHSILKHGDKFSEQSHCVLVCDQFLFMWVQYEEVLHHVLRVLWNVYEKVDSQQMIHLLTATQPTPQHSEVLHDLHSRLVETIASSKASSSFSGESSNHSSRLGVSPPSTFDAMDTT